MTGCAQSSPRGRFRPGIKGCHACAHGDLDFERLVDVHSCEAIGCATRHSDRLVFLAAGVDEIGLSHTPSVLWGRSVAQLNDWTRALNSTNDPPVMGMTSVVTGPGICQPTSRGPCATPSSRRCGLGRSSIAIPCANPSVFSAAANPFSDGIRNYRVDAWWSACRHGDARPLVGYVFR